MSISHFFSICEDFFQNINPSFDSYSESEDKDELDKCELSSLNYNDKEYIDENSISNINNKISNGYFSIFHHLLQLLIQFIRGKDTRYQE